MFHKSVISLRKALGCHETEDGCCRGVTLRWLEACILNEEKIFDARIRKIHADGNSLVQSIDSVKKKVRDKKELTREDLDLLDILAFYESLELYHSAYKFQAIFNNKYHSQYDIDSISSLAASDQILDCGGLTTIYSEPGIYTIDEISVYLDEVATAIQKSNCTSGDIQGIIVGNANHTIGLIYQPQAGWKFMDINQYPSMAFKRTQDVAKQIAIGYMDLANTSPWFAFNTTVIVTSNHANRSQLTEQLGAVKKRHVITTEIAQREGIINLAWIAARHGEADLITTLWKYGAKLDMVDNDGATPAFMAAENGHANVIAALGKANADLNKARNNGATPAFMAAQNGHVDVITKLEKAHADLDKARDDGTTPAFMAAQNGHANVIAALGEAGADLGKAMNNGATPAFIAAQKGQIHVITALLLHNAKMDIPFTASAENLRDFALTHGELVISRMNTIIKNQLNSGAKAESITIKPYDIAWIMGHDAIVNLLREKLEVSSSGMFAADNLKKPAIDRTEEKGSEKDIGLALK